MNYYFHLPFCRSKCGYCAFYSEIDLLDQVDSYIETLVRELESGLLLPAETIYFGGGTPTLLSVEQLELLLSKVTTLLPGAKEISMEANPETLNDEKVALLRCYITRISLGVQSFNPVHRASIGRKCSNRVLDDCLSLISAAEFPHWNLDLMYALPGQTIRDWQRELQCAIATGVDHLSLYALTAEEHAKYGKLICEDDDFAAELWELSGEILASAGFARYEISNYARFGGECQHNLNVWKGGCLRGLGATAASFDGTDRWLNAPTIQKYLHGCPPECDHLDREARLREIFVINLRTIAGWERKDWHFDPWENRLNSACRVAEKLPGCLNISNDHVRLSQRGLMFWNVVAEELL